MKTRIIVALLTAVTLDAQAPHPQSDPAAVAIHQRHLKASGGDAQPQHVHWIAEMTVAGGVGLRTEVFMSQPNKVLMRNTMGGQVLLEFGFDGTTGWTSSAAGGVATVAGAELEAMRAGVTNIMDSPIDPAARLVAAGRTTFEEEPADRVLAITAAGDTLEAYYAVSTGLLVGMRMPPSPGLPGESLMLFRDYKPFGGRVTPTTLVVRMSGMEAVSRTVHMDTDPIPDERFRKP